MGAKFRFLGTERGIVFIEDLDQGISVTNDAENVWHRTISGLGAAKRLVYKDTQGEWWEIIPSYEYSFSGKYDKFSPYFKRWHGHAWDILKGNV